MTFEIKKMNRSSIRRNFDDDMKHCDGGRKKEK